MADSLELAQELLDAAYVGDAAVVRELLELGAYIHATDGDQGLCALHIACREGYVDIVQILVEADRSTIGATCYYLGFTPLHYAVHQFDIVQFLISNGADLDATGDCEYTPLHTACSRSEYWNQGSFDVINLLIEQGADLHARTDCGKTPLHLVCEDGRLDVIQLLLRRGADINAKDERGSTPLNIACSIGGFDAVKLLVQNGANVNNKDTGNGAPLHHACVKGNLDIIKLLIEKGAEVDARKDDHNDNSTSLHFACAHGKLEVAEVLLNRGANIDIETSEGYTPLHLASEYNHPDIVFLLVRQYPRLVLDYYFE